MKPMKHASHGALLSLLCTLASCMTGGGDAPLGASPSLIGPDAGVITAARWHQAPAGCEGRVSSSDIHIGWAEGASELGVVLSRGQIVCVDSWGAIEAELDRFKGDPAPDPMLPRGSDLPAR